MRFNNSLLTALCLISTNAIWAVDEVVTGHEVAYIEKVSSYALSGEHDNNIEHKNTCLQKFSWIINNEPLEIDYKVFVKTNMQSATIKLMNTTALLSPMGISDSYSFLTQKGIPDDLKNFNIRQIYFKLNNAFELKKIAVSFLDDSLDFQCIAESNY